MMMKTATEKGFREYVYEAVAQIPFGKLATYGDIAAIAGKLYLMQHLDVLDELYQAGPQRIMPHFFDTSERN